MKIRGAGKNDNIESQVDPTHQAMRVQTRPIEHNGTDIPGGHYRASAITGAVAGVIAANGQLLQLVWKDKLKRLVVLKILASGKCEAFSTGIGVDLEAIIHRGVTAVGSGGTAIVPSGANLTMRSAAGKGMAASTLADAAGGDFRVATTAALTAPTGGALDNVGIGCGMIGATGAGAGGQIELYKHEPGTDHPLVLGNGDALIIRTTNGIAASNTWRFGFALTLLEAVDY